jgi:hypothetical protein
MTTSLVTNDSPLFLTKVTVSDADYATTLTNGLLIAYTALTAPRTVTLPPATTSGQIVMVVDESGSCSQTNTITIVGTIDGATNKTLNSPYSSITLESNGAGGYAILSKNDNLDAITKDPTGFSDPAAVTETYDSTNRTVTLTGTFSAYWQGELIPVLTNGWVSPAHPATAGPWFLFYNGTSFVWQQTSWTFDMLQIAYVVYGATDKFALRECHGLMPWQSHQEFHQTIGTYSTGGGDLSSYALSSTTVADRRPAVSSATLHDEDLTTVVAALPAAGPYTQLYLTSTGTTTFTTAAAEIVPVSGNQPYYNQFTGGNWTQTLMSNNSYMSIWLVAVPAQADAGSQAYRYLWVQGQTNGNLATEQAIQFKDLNLGQISALFPEFVAIDKVIIQYTAGNWTIQEVDKLTGSKISPGSSTGNYLSSVSVAAPLTGNGTSVTPLAIPAATASVNGYLTSTDWNTFNGKQAAYTLLTTFGSLANAPGFPKNDGSGVLSYDNTPQNTALWGSITGTSAQAAPAGGWTGNHGAMSMGALAATTGTFSSTITGTSFNGITGLASVTPLADGIAAVGTSTLTARQDHVHPQVPLVVGDGNTSQFLYVGPTVTKTDWQGTQTLYSTARTNYALRSEAIDLWNLVGITVTTNNWTGPNGSATGDTLVESTATSSHQANRPFDGVASQPFTYSIYFKSGTRRYIKLALNDGTTYAASVFDTQTGTVFSTQAGSASVANLGGGVYRAIITGTGTTNGSGNGTIYMQMSADGSNVTYAGDGTSSVPLWGAQLERSTVATSYIPTTTAAATLTDYTVTNGIATLSPTPAQGVILKGIAPYAAWGNITGASAQAAPAGGWTGNHGAMNMGALTATTGSFSGSVSQTTVAFASLPTGSAGMRAFVNNNSSGAAFGSAANGSGSTTYPVYHDGVSWKIG